MASPLPECSVLATINGATYLKSILNTLTRNSRKKLRVVFDEERIRFKYYKEADTTSGKVVIIISIVGKKLLEYFFGYSNTKLTLDVDPVLLVNSFGNKPDIVNILMPKDNPTELIISPGTPYGELSNGRTSVPTSVPDNHILPFDDYKKPVTRTTLTFFVNMFKEFSKREDVHYIIATIYPYGITFNGHSSPSQRPVSVNSLGDTETRFCDLEEEEEVPTFSLNLNESSSNNATSFEAPILIEEDRGINPEFILSKKQIAFIQKLGSVCNGSVAVSFHYQKDLPLRISSELGNIGRYNIYLEGLKTNI